MNHPLQFCHELGWAFIPLNGKIPIQQDWQHGPPASLAQVSAWERASVNLGLRTGSASGGIVVVDIDLPKGAVIPADLPVTATVETGGGGLHMYYYAPDGVTIRNSAGKLAPRIDIRGDGGFVVFPGSIHPDTEAEYKWLYPPWETPIAVLPEWVISVLTEQPTPCAPVRVEIKQPTSAYQAAALRAECATVAQAAEGTRNHVLNTAAYKLGGLGITDAPELVDAALQAGLSHHEATRTVASGLQAGAAKPRTVYAPAPATPEPTPEPPAPAPVAKPTSYTTGTDFFTQYRHDLLHGEPPVVWRLGEYKLGEVEFGPGKILLLGGGPGAGKTAFVMGALFDSLRLNPDLRALVVNVEMSAAQLLNRQLASMSCVPLHNIKHKDVRKFALRRDQEQFDRALDNLQALTRRVTFLNRPFTLEHAGLVARDTGSSVLVLDYIQRFECVDKAESRTHAIEKNVDHSRALADEGMGILMVSALGRPQQKEGKGYAGADITSFRGSSELEYGGDIIYTLERARGAEDATLVCHKNRDGEPVDIEFKFDQRIQRFTQKGQDGAYTQKQPMPPIENTYNEEDDTPF